MSDDTQNGWSEYSRLVLKELESLAENISALNKEIQDLKQEIAQMRAREDRVDDIKIWKEKTTNGYMKHWVMVKVLHT